MKKIKIRAATFAGHCANGVGMSRIPLRATAFFALKPYGADGHDHFFPFRYSMALVSSCLDIGQQAFLHAFKLCLRPCALLVQREDIPQVVNTALHG